MVILSNLQSILKLSQVGQLCFIKLKWFVFKFLCKNVDNIPEDMENKPGNNLKNSFYNFDKLLRVKILNWIDIRTLGLNYT